MFQRNVIERTGVLCNLDRSGPSRYLVEVWVIVEVVQMLVRAKAGGKSLDRGSDSGAMSRLSQCRMCAEEASWFAEG